MRDQTLPASTAPDHGGGWRPYAVGLSAGAGLIHWIVAPEHFGHWWGYGWFFLAVGAMQVAYAVLLALDEPTRRVLGIGLVGTGLIVLLYLFTRTLGIPFIGPSVGEVEPIGPVDLISKATELALMACLALMLWARRDVAPERNLPSGVQSTHVGKDRDG